MIMKKDIHPITNTIKVECSCGNSFETTSSLKENARVEICSACHPYYTGEQKILKTGAVDKFYARMKKSEAMKK